MEVQRGLTFRKEIQGLWSCRVCGCIFCNPACSGLSQGTCWEILELLLLLRELFPSRCPASTNRDLSFSASSICCMYHYCKNSGFSSESKAHRSVAKWLQILPRLWATQPLVQARASLLKQGEVEMYMWYLCV